MEKRECLTDILNMAKLLRLEIMGEVLKQHHTAFSLEEGERGNGFGATRD